MEKLSRLANPRFAEILQDPERTGNYLTAAVTDEIIAKLNLMRQPQAAAVFVENKRSETEETKRPFIAKVRTDQEQLQDLSDLLGSVGISLSPSQLRYVHQEHVQSRGIVKEIKLSGLESEIKTLQGRKPYDYSNLQPTGDFNVEIFAQSKTLPIILYLISHKH